MGCWACIALMDGLLTCKIQKYLYITILINIVNINLGFLFVYGLEMEIKGIALASVIAKYVGFFAFIFIGFKKYRWLRLYLYIDWNMLKDRASYLPFFKVNNDIFVRTQAISISNNILYVCVCKRRERYT